MAQRGACVKDPRLGDSMRVTTIGVSEGGMAVRLPKRQRPSGRWQISYALPERTFH